VFPSFWPRNPRSKDRLKSFLHEPFSSRTFYP
jgi:hypothetical protein